MPGPATAHLLAADLRRLRSLALAIRKFVDQRIEIAGLAKIAIDRGEAYISDAVERAKTFHDEFADPATCNFAVALTLKLAHDSIHHPLDAIRLNRTLAQGDFERAHEFIAIERHPPAGFFQDHQFAQLHALERRETAAAIGTDPAAANGRRIAGRARVLHLGFKTAAIRAPHGGPASKHDGNRRITVT